jgi:hypothetical protein
MRSAHHSASRLNTPSRGRAFQRRFWLGLAASILFLLGPRAALAQSERTGSDPGRDCRLTLRARDVMLHDPALSGMTHLGVTVRGGVAVLWGAVPSSEAARRAELLVKQVPGIMEIRSELRVDSPDDPVVQFLRSRPGQVAGAPSRQWVSANRPAALLTFPTPEATPASESAARTGITLLPPTISTVPLANGGDLAGRIAALQQADPRFLGIVADVQQGVVRLGGTVTRWEDLFDLARAISHLPGVERVVLHDVRTPRDRR